MNSFTELQAMTDEWRQHNFPKHQDGVNVIGAWENLTGMMEEMGELSHAFLKKFQGIRTDENLDHLEKDAIGDLVIYLCGYCSRRGISLAECIDMAWWEVKDRDWIKYPGTGRPPSVDDTGRVGEDDRGTERKYTTGSEAPGFGGPIEDA